MRACDGLTPVLAAMAAFGLGCLPPESGQAEPRSDAARAADVAGDASMPHMHGGDGTTDGGLGEAAGGGQDAQSQLLSGGCGTATYRIDLTGSSGLYDPATVVGKAGECGEICIRSLDGQPHQNGSDDGLFTDYTTADPDYVCKVFTRIPEPGPHGITCHNHVNMTATLIIK